MPIVWRNLRCTKCRADHPTMVVRLWGLDENGCQWFDCFCRECGKQTMLTHDFDEQRADVREAYHAWCEQAGEGSKAYDWKLWEWEVRDGEDSA